MSQKTSIEWTDASWNPVRGCVKVSPGCKNCYASVFAERFRGVPGHAYERGFDPRLVPESLDAPLRWKKPRRIFVNSMSDLFQEAVPDEYIAAVFGVMASCPQHTFQVLTKRAERMPEWFAWVAKRTEQGKSLFPDDDDAWRTWQFVYVEAHRKGAGAALNLHHGGAWPLPNVHLGVSVEDRKYGLPRLEHLRATPAAVRFVSIEPLLEDLGDIDLTGIHQVIVGGESGGHSRPFDFAWMQRVKDQAREQGVKFFAKQGGDKAMLDGQLLKLGKKGSDPSEWPGGAAAWPREFV